MENRTDTTQTGVSTLKEVGGIHLTSKYKNCQSLNLITKELVMSREATGYP